MEQKGSEKTNIKKHFKVFISFFIEWENQQIIGKKMKRFDAFLQLKSVKKRVNLPTSVRKLDIELKRPV